MENSSERYRIRIGHFFLYMPLWSIWMAVWCWVPGEELVWPPIKWIVITLFLPIGLVLLGSLTGFRVDYNRERIWIGFFPFIRRIKVRNIADIRKGAVYPMSLWHTTDFITLVPKKGKPFSFPCNDAGRKIKTIKSYIDNPAC